ncbi:MAG: class I SAM-dependent methyltransferase, partial [Candidatus Competibacteraceae bacterium]
LVAPALWRAIAGGGGGGDGGSKAAAGVRVSGFQVYGMTTSYGHQLKNSGSHRYLMPWVERLCEKYGGGRRIIDIGCGNGATCRDLSQRGYQVVGLEPSEDGFRLARQNAPDARIYQLSAYTTADALPETSFDIAISLEVIEHLDRPGALVGLVFQLLAENGVLIVSTPYHGWLKNVLIAAAGKWDQHHQPLNDHGHIKFWSRATLSRLLHKNGFSVVDFVGVGRFPLLWKSMIIIARKRS